MAPGSATLEMAFSMVKLPKDPMMPRLFDERVGYFSLDLIDYGREEHRATERTYITRWRLEKQRSGGRAFGPCEADRLLH